MMKKMKGKGMEIIKRKHEKEEDREVSIPTREGIENVLKKQRTIKHQEKMV
jgi:hypothetical protein